MQVAVWTLLVGVVAGASTVLNCKQTCITKIRPMASELSSLPTSTRYITHTVVSTTTPSTLSSITSNEDCTSEEVSSSAAPSTVTVTTTTTTTVPASNSACSTTTTVSASGKQTSYTGSLDTALARRTQGPFGHRAPHWASPLVHYYGRNRVESLEPVDRKPYEVDCLDRVTAHVYVTAGENVTAMCAVQEDAQPASTVTSTVTVTASASANAGVCTVTQGDSTGTTTQHVKCAPTNMITQVNGKGIGAVQGSSNGTQGLAPGSDPSACCQMCVDTPNCAASEDDKDAGNCFLWYTSPSCGLALSYSPGGKNLSPGTGFFIQTGCGSVAVGQDL
ncbi:hypothetical protein K470DRAFT_282293 [Piedraia hortae CBS 480.64]|uniref:Apple domain-containing protein n=1 Tax=Piedraia hortae CBS 480.64 TaxID=1314780 RepID=A0A6A7C042_9PEZI|nr:hypothetical protein K470DRAFT_282293 [Piedraia hortae CBS 480.64]